MKSQEEEAILGLFFTINNGLYGIAFGTHAKMAEPVEMPFGMMAWVGPRYHVLDGGLNPPKRKVQFFGVNVVERCKVMGHTTVSYAKMAELIEKKTRGGSNEPFIRWGCRSPKGKGNFWWLSGLFKSIGNLYCSVTATFMGKGIIQLPINSCSRWDH